MTRSLPLLLTAAIAAACGLATGTRPVEPAPASPKPLTFSILEDYDKGDDLADIAADFRLFRELDITAWRGSLGWDDYEPEPGRYDFVWLHDFLSLAASHGLTLRPYIGYTPEWAALGGGADTDGQAWNQPPRDQRRWRAFIEALAAELRHHPNVPSIEIYNEQNVRQWWEGTVEQYADTLRTAAGVIRPAPAFQILAGGLVFPQLDWVETLCGIPGTSEAFDILPVHAYPETWTPPGVTLESYLGAGFSIGFGGAVDRACGPKRIWINETGFATVPGKSEMDQAAWWARAIAVFAAEPRVEHIGIYEIKDLRPDRPAIGDAPNYHLGLTRTDRTRKLAFATVDVLTDLLDVGSVTRAPGDITVSPAPARGERHVRVLRRPDGDRIAIVWNRTASERVSVQVRGAVTAVTEYGLTGGSSPVEVTGASFTTALERGIPRIFRIAPGS